MADINKILVEGTNAAGGFLVPDEFAARVYELIQAKTIVLPDLETVQMNSDVMYIPKTTNGSTAYWVAETGAITASTPGYGRITLTAKKVAALINASTEILEDANVSVANLIVEQMSRDLALSIDNEILNGTGAAFVGLRDTASFTNSYSAGNGTTSGNIGLTAISKAVDTILADNHTMPDVSYWNPRTVGSLRVLTDSTGRPMFNQETFGSPLLKTGVVGTVYGMGVKPSTQLPINLSYGTASAQTTCADAIVGVSKQFGIFGNRRGLTFKQDYAIANDYNQYQVTMRGAFSVKYPDSYCVIRAIQD
jgi:HK97 family phage major capsid protein